jgi:hypothetical protein
MRQGNRAGPQEKLEKSVVTRGSRFADTCPADLQERLQESLGGS